MRELATNSRFRQTPTVVHTDGIERFIEWSPPRYGVVEDEVVYTVTDQDINRPDLISFRNYGASDLWWLVLHYNNIIDPFSMETGDRILIPGVSVVNQTLSKMRQNTLPTRVIRVAAPAPVVKVTPYTVVPYKRPTTDAELASGEPEVTSASDSLFVYGFRVPDGLTDLVHFQLVASPDTDFDPVVFNKFTVTSQARWFYYNPAANAGAGSYVAFPSSGIDGELFAGQTVYYNVSNTDGLVANVPYYVRYRTWIDNAEGLWNVSPPIIIPA